MYKNKHISIILCLLMVFCSGDSTSEIVGSTVSTDTTSTQLEETQTETQTENQTQEKEGQEQQPQNNKNPFLNPEYSDCLRDEFGNERFEQLQNERPTSEEEQRIARCMGGQGQGPQGQGPQGQGPEESAEQTIEKAIGVIQNATQEVLDCISNYFGTEVYKKVVEDLEPDEFEAGIVIQCKEAPQGSTEEAGGSSGENSSEADNTTAEQASSPEVFDDWYSLNVYEYNSSYSVPTSNSNTGFGLNESADIILSGYGFNNSGGKTKLNHPVSVSSDGQKLAVTDRFNNRILIWNTIPNKKTDPDIVIGQQNFTTQNHGSALNQLNFPGQVIITPDSKMLVADSENDRVLVWTTFPTVSGQSADYAIPVTDYVSMGDSWPWGVWSNGEKTIITATVAETVLFWNSFPGPSTPPDVTLQSSQIGTPRSIISNGDYIMIGDENASGSCSGLNGNRSTHVFTSWPTSSKDPDACVEQWVSGVIDNGKIYSIPAGGEFLYLWDELYTTSADLKSKAKNALPGQGHRWAGGDDGGATVANGKLFIAEYNGNRISVYDSLPTSATQKPDWSLMADNILDYPLIDDFIIQNPVPESDGGIFIVTSGFDRSLSVWKKHPGSNGAKPDMVFRRFDDQPWDNTFNNKALFIAGRNKVFGWYDFEKTIESGNYSFDINTSEIGSISLNSIKGIAYNGTYFAIGTTEKKIYIWEGIPAITDEPKYTLSSPVGVGRMDMNNDWLVFSPSPSSGQSVHAIKLSELAGEVFRPVPGYSDFPQGVSINEKGFFIAEQGKDRVVGWSNVEEALNGTSHTMSFGGDTGKTGTGTKMASSVHWDGHYLWVGEFKFSNRLTGFAPSK